MNARRWIGCGTMAVVGLVHPIVVLATPAFLNPSLDPAFSAPSPPTLPQETFSLQTSGQRSQGEAWQRLIATYRYDTRWFLTTGYEWYQTWGEDATEHGVIPLQIGTAFQRETISGSLALGVDLKTKPGSPLRLDLKVSRPIAPLLAPELSLTCESYRGRATSLGVYACRPGVSLFSAFSPQWQTFWAYRHGFYSDGNREHQIIGQLAYQPTPYLTLKANLFNWSYSLDQSTYFSPRDFLVISGEAEFTAALSRDLTCRVGVTLGQQRLQSHWSEANAYQGNCSWNWQDHLDLSTQLRFSNVLNQPATAYNSAEWTLKMQWRY